jgi:ssDNA-binding Zn-finger/Zn-ribbon topoisomerase 1
MAEQFAVPVCPTCGATMVARRRRSDGEPFWGCSRFPQCRGIREVVGGMPASGQASVPAASTEAGRRRSFHFDRVVLGFAAVGLVVAFGLIVSAMTIAPKIYGLFGASFIFLVAVTVIPSPLLRPGDARYLELRIMGLILLVTFVLIGSQPLWNLITPYFTDIFMKSIPTPH